MDDNDAVAQRQRAPPRTEHDLIKGRASKTRLGRATHVEGRAFHDTATTRATRASARAIRRASRSCAFIGSMLVARVALQEIQPAPGTRAPRYRRGMGITGTPRAGASTRGRGTKQTPYSSGSTMDITQGP